jgi:AAA15 family ATPase/GTPase
MIIKKVEIKNYRNFDTASAEFSKFNVLIGKNGTGKSNFMNAIMLPLRAATLNGEIFDPKKDKRNPKADTMIKVRSDLSQEESTNFISGNSGNVAHELLYQFLSQANNIQPSIIINQIDTSNASPPSTTSFNSLFGQTITVQISFGYDSFKLLYETLIYPLPDSREIPEVFKASMPKISSSFDFGNALLDMKLNFRDKYDNLIKVIKQISPEILDIPVNLGKNLAWEIGFKEANINTILSAKDISKGTREIVMMLMLLEVSHEKSAILIEEPEVHLYPFALKNLKKIMFQYIRDKNIQIIISTHSPDLLSDLYPSQNKEVKFFEFDKINGGSSIKELIEDKEIADLQTRMSAGS